MIAQAKVLKVTLGGTRRTDGGCTERSQSPSTGCDCLSTVTVAIVILNVLLSNQCNNKPE